MCIALQKFWFLMTVYAQKPNSFTLLTVPLNCPSAKWPVDLYSDQWSPLFNSDELKCIVCMHLSNVHVDSVMRRLTTHETSHFSTQIF